MEAILNPPETKMPRIRGDVVGEGVTQLDEENQVVVLYNVMTDEEVEDYLREALNVERVSGTSGYGQKKPRMEVCYTVDGKPYKYSGKKHVTTKYPPHVLSMLDKVHQKWGVEQGELSTAVDIIYSPAQVRGGSIGRHSDDEMDWKYVAIYSLGQTRYLRVRRIEDGKWYNVPVKSNSLVCMVGKSFQKKYTHQVDKLPVGAEVGTRLSLNVRYL